MIVEAAGNSGWEGTLVALPSVLRSPVACELLWRQNAKSAAYGFHRTAFPLYFICCLGTSVISDPRFGQLLNFHISWLLDRIWKVWRLADAVSSFLNLESSALFAFPSFWYNLPCDQTSAWVFDTPEQSWGVLDRVWTTSYRLQSLSGKVASSTQGMLLILIWPYADSICLAAHLSAKVQHYPAWWEPTGTTTDSVWPSTPPNTHTISMVDYNIRYPQKKLL